MKKAGVTMTLLRERSRYVLTPWEVPSRVGSDVRVGG